MTAFAESHVEAAAIEWLAALGYSALHGPEIAFGQTAAERPNLSYRDVLLDGRVHGALVRLNPELPSEAIGDAYRRITKTDAPSLIERNRAVHRMLVDGVTVEYRRKDGSIAGAQARVIDFDDPDNNDWLAVNQFTVSRGTAHPPSGRCGFRQRAAARRDRTEERRRRERRYLVGVPPAPDLSITDPGAVRHQRGTRRFRWRSGANRFARRGQGMVQAVAHDHRP